MPKEQSPVILMPDDPERAGQLRMKLEEYKKRLKPGVNSTLQMDTLCKLEVLEKLLAEGRVITWDLSRKLAKQYGDAYNPSDFQNACAVIHDYCLTGGANNRGGTGFK